MARRSRSRAPADSATAPAAEASVTAGTCGALASESSGFSITVSNVIVNQAAIAARAYADQQAQDAGHPR
jgi:hypothetical protein